MAGGFSTRKRDRGIKASTGTTVKTGQIIARGLTTYKPGVNVKGLGTIFALCPGKVYFTKKKTSHGKLRTFINVQPTIVKEKPKK
ncbi:MAG: 50S ribosomal protein L27 [Candidatus Omnitrophica bacterium]|nr:50S ribosomal protein L27 [Candidatus Omnitrophota bacterium]